MCTGATGRSPRGTNRSDRRRDVADLRGYAAGLGLDAAVDKDLLWLAREALCQPLPSSWKEHSDETGRVYFFREATKESSWFHPADTVFMELITVIKAARTHQSSERRSAAVEDHLLVVHQRAEKELNAWSGPYEAEAGEYYYNEALDVSSWSNPAEEWQIELDLRQRVLQRCLLEDCHGGGSGGRAASEDSFRTGHSSRASSPAISCRSCRSGRSPTPPQPRRGAEAAGPCVVSRPSLTPRGQKGHRGGAAQLSFEAQILAFARDPNRASLELPPSLSPAERKKAKELALQHGGLTCEAIGFGPERRLHLFRDDPVASRAEPDPAGCDDDTESEQEITFGPSAANRLPWKFETAAA